MSKNPVVRQLITIGIISLVLTSTTVVLAAYKPPRGQRPPSGRTTTTGSRGGCDTKGSPSLKLLAPQNHVGQTTSNRPTFAWFVSDSKPLPMQFRLYKYDHKGELKLQHQLQIQSKYGIMTLPLPKNKPALEVNKRYLWQVVILCDPKQPANDLVEMAEIDVVKRPSKLHFVRSRRANVNILAEAGLWYDALDEALQLGEKDAVLELMNNLATLESSKTGN